MKSETGFTERHRSLAPLQRIDAFPFPLIDHRKSKLLVSPKFRNHAPVRGFPRSNAPLSIDFARFVTKRLQTLGTKRTARASRGHHFFNVLAFRSADHLKPVLRGQFPNVTL